MDWLWLLLQLKSLGEERPTTSLCYIEAESTSQEIIPMARKAPVPRHEKLEPSITATTIKILEEFGVPPAAWDVLIVGDGSGTGWNNSCGWASILIDKRSQLRKSLLGGMNAGTSYLAELLPYVQALSWYIDGPGRALLADKRAADLTATVNVHIITDAEVVARQGSGKISRRKGRPYWAMMEALEDNGFTFSWHWLKRSKIELNQLCDYLASLSRQSIGQVTGVQLPYSLYDYNRDESS